MRLALAQFAASPPPNNFEDFCARLKALAHDAASSGADILVLPEYAALVLSGAVMTNQDLAAELDCAVTHAGALVENLLAIAVGEGIHILGGTIPMRGSDGKICNRAPILAPNGKFAFQDKQHMTRFETEQWHIAPGLGPKIFETAFGRIGVSICYDSEFPLHARAQAQAGAQILLIPTCTDTLAGFNRVRLSARARALENQFFTAISPLVGVASWSEAIDHNTGYAALYAPPDRCFPDDGVLARGTLNEPSLLIADADTALIEQTRRDGAVLNHRDWPATPPCEIVQLS